MNKIQEINYLKSKIDNCKEMKLNFISLPETECLWDEVDIMERKYKKRLNEINKKGDDLI